MNLKRKPQEGERVHIIRGDLSGSIGRVRKVYKNDCISVSIMPGDLKVEGKLALHPDGTYHWICEPGEFHILDRGGGVF